MYSQPTRIGVRTLKISYLWADEPTISAATKSINFIRTVKRGNKYSERKKTNMYQYMAEVKIFTKMA